MSLNLNNMLTKKGEKMKVLEALDVELVLVDLEVNLGKKNKIVQHYALDIKGKLFL